MTNTFTKGIGRLAVDRYNFQDHVDGYKLNHNAGGILLSPSLTINSTLCTSVQGALTAALPFLVPPTVVDASTVVKGIVQLAGDITGTATNVIVAGLLNRPLNNLVPNALDVLTWTGSAWEPEAVPNMFVAGGNLYGSNTSQSIESIDGYAGLVTINCNDTVFAPSLTPTIYQTAVAGAAHNFTIKAQKSTGAAGGSLYLSSGQGVTAHGELILQLKDGYRTLVQLIEPTLNSAVLALVTNDAITFGEMPAGTGDRVIYIGNAGTVPTVSPSNGAIFYADNGKLWVKEEGGNNYALGGYNIVLYDAVAETDGYSTGSWVDYASTTSASYTTISMTTSYVAQAGDIIKLNYSGFVGNGRM